MRDIGKLTDTFAGEVVRPGDDGYDSARAVWNGTIDRRPALVVRPTSNDDVVAALRFAREQDLVVAVRCGGHSIPGLSTCDDGIVIDLKRIKGAHVDVEQRTARVGGGALLSVLDDAAQAHGLVCPVGVVSHTGVAGLTLGGGMGRLQRKHGLTIDSLLAVELVTADGRLVRASEDEHPELFWGMRGAGPNFGIVTSFEFRLHPFDGRVVHGTVSLPVERYAELAEHFHDLVENGPDELWMSFALTARRDVAGGAVATVAVMHLGSERDADRDLAALRAVEGSLDGPIEPKEYLDVQRVMDAPMAWGQRFSYKSAFIASLPDELMRAWAEHTPRLPEGADGGFSIWAWGRAIAAVPEEDTAFTGRDAAFWAGTEAFWRDPELDEACRSWARTGNELAEPYALVGRYVNDVVEVGDDVVRSVYGDAKYERLVALKREWDPDNVFRLNQNIRP